MTHASYSRCVCDWRQVLGRPIAFNAVPADTYLGFLPALSKEIVSHLLEKGVHAVPLSDATLRLTGRHTSYEEWLSRPENKAKFE
jgi:hypothetical protein